MENDLPVSGLRTVTMKPNASLRKSTLASIWIRCSLQYLLFNSTTSVNLISQSGAVIHLEYSLSLFLFAFLLSFFSGSRRHALSDLLVISSCSVFHSFFILLSMYLLCSHSPNDHIILFTGHPQCQPPPHCIFPDEVPST